LVGQHWIASCRVITFQSGSAVGYTDGVGPGQLHGQGHGRSRADFHGVHANQHCSGATAGYDQQPATERAGHGSLFDDVRCNRRHFALYMVGECWNASCRIDTFDCGSVVRDADSVGPGQLHCQSHGRSRADFHSSNANQYCSGAPTDYDQQSATRRAGHGSLFDDVRCNRRHFALYLERECGRTAKWIDTLDCGGVVRDADGGGPGQLYCQGHGRSRADFHSANANQYFSGAPTDYDQQSAIERAGHGCLFGDARCERRYRAIHLECECGCSTKWIDSFDCGGVVRDADGGGPGQLHCQGHGRSRADFHSSNANQYCSGAPTDYDQQSATRRASYGSICGDAHSNRRHFALYLERECGRSAKWVDTFDCGSVVGNSDGGGPGQFHGQGHGRCLSDFHSANANQHCSGATADYDQQSATERAGHRCLFGNARCHRRDRALHLERERRNASCWIDTFKCRSVVGYADGVGPGQFYSQGHGRSRADFHGGNANQYCSGAAADYDQQSATRRAGHRCLFGDAHCNRRHFTLCMVGECWNASCRIDTFDCGGVVGDTYDVGSG